MSFNFIKRQISDVSFFLKKIVLQLGTLYLDGRKVFVSMAISRGELQKKTEDKEKKKKENKGVRNLWLAREGSKIISSYRTDDRTVFVYSKHFFNILWKL